MNNNPKISPQTASEREASVLISAETVAQMLNVSPRTVWRLLSAGKLIEPIRIGGNTRWRSAEMRDWIAEGCPSPDGTT